MHAHTLHTCAHDTYHTACMHTQHTCTRCIPQYIHAHHHTHMCMKHTTHILHTCMHNPLTDIACHACAHQHDTPHYMHAHTILHRCTPTPHHIHVHTNTLYHIACICTHLAHKHTLYYIHMHMTHTILYTCAQIHRHTIGHGRGYILCQAAAAWVPSRRG